MSISCKHSTKLQSGERCTFLEVSVEKHDLPDAVKQSCDGADRTDSSFQIRSDQSDFSAPSVSYFLTSLFDQFSFNRTFLFIILPRSLLKRQNKDFGSK